MIRVVFRLDDPSSTSIHSLEKEILGIFEKFGMCCTFAVVPFRRKEGHELVLDKDQVSHLVNAYKKGILGVALHGFQHRRHSTGIDSEFVGIPISEQRAMLANGKAVLENVFGDTIAGFVPPWNTFDRNTVQALEELGFTYCAAGRVSELGNTGKLRFVPSTCHLPQVKEAIKEARRFSYIQPIIIIVMHHFDFEESGEKQAVISLALFEELLAWLSRQNDIKVSTLAAVADSIKGNQAKKQKSLEQWRSRLPYRFHKYLPNMFFTEHSLWKIQLCHILFFK